MAFPSPPWRLCGQAWLSAFWTGAPGETPGPYVCGFVSYEPAGVLAYRELFVARRRGPGLRRLTITHIWVDSPASAEGGRALWGIPKELADLEEDRSGLGLVGRASWSASLAGLPIASASFADTSQAALRMPFAATLDQPRADGPDAVTPLTGSGRTLPCLGHWDFAADGPLGWLAGKQPVASFRVRDFRLTFG